ncbi:MAG: hypothetical protein WC758_08805, partial [Candidatus Woesearchaeota archaeon]
ESYTSADKFFKGKRTKGNDAKKIIEPNLCFFGMSTERQIFDGLRTSDLADGSLARYLMLFGNNGMMPRRINNYDLSIPQKIIDGINELKDKYCNQNFISSVSLDISSEYDDFKFNLMCDMKARGNILREKGGDKAFFVPFYNRIAVRSVQSAMLIDQCQDIEILKWLANLDLQSSEVFMKKFLHLGSDNDNERLSKLLNAKIKESGKKGISAKDLIKITQQIQPHIRKSMIDELLFNDVISTKLVKLNGSQRSSTVYFWNK